LAKDKQNKHKAAETTSASGKMRRKEFEKELAKLQALCRRSDNWLVAALGAHEVLNGTY
jgi:polyphosphate kinase